MNTLTINRPLDAGERFFWLLDRVSGMNFVVFADIASPLDAARLQAVVSAAQQRHPLLRAKIVRKGACALWFEPAANALSIGTTAVDDHSWRQAIEQELSHQFELDDAPLIRCRLLQFAGDKRSIVALTFHHALADGRSGTALLREILAAYADDRQLSGNPGRLHPPMHDVFPEHFRWHQRPDAALELANIRKADLKRHGKPHALAMLDQQQPQRIPRFIPVVMEAAASARLLADCKRNGATLHGALGAAQLLATYRLNNQDMPLVLSLGSPADMRPHLDREIPLASLGVYVTLLFSSYRIDDEVPFWQLARDVGADIRKQLARGEGHLLYTLLRPDTFAPDTEGIAAFAQMMLASPQSSMISNIGVVNPVAGMPEVTSIAFVLCPMPYQLMFTAVSTFNGALMLNVAYDGAKLSDDSALQLAQSIRQALESAGTK